MDKSKRRIERVAMYAANMAEGDGVDFWKLMQQKIPGVTREEIDRGLIRGTNRLGDKLAAKFGMPPDEHMPEGPLDHTEHDPEN